MGNESSKQSSPNKPRGWSKKRPNSSSVSRRLSMGSMAPPLPPVQVKVGSTSCIDPSNGEVSPLKKYSDSRLSIDQSSRSRSGSASSNIVSVKSKACNALPRKDRQLIQSCFHNSFVEGVGQRILKRAVEKRKDFGKFYIALSNQQRDELADTVKTLLKKSVANIECFDELQRLAAEFGQKFVEFRMQGFKADYFATLANSTITECIFLDNAVHPAHQTLNAFSQFITMLFSSVRDGYYFEMRRLRRISNSFSTGSNGSANGGHTKKSVDDRTRSRDMSPRRSVSPGPEDNSSQDSLEDQDQVQSYDKSVGSDCHGEKENNWPTHYSSRHNVDSNGLLMPPTS